MWSAVLKATTPHRRPTDDHHHHHRPPWLHRSGHPVAWARTMLNPGRAVVIDCETTDLPGAITDVPAVDIMG